MTSFKSPPPRLPHSAGRPSKLGSMAIYSSPCVTPPPLERRSRPLDRAPGTSQCPDPVTQSPVPPSRGPGPASGGHDPAFHPTVPTSHPLDSVSQGADPPCLSPFPASRNCLPITRATTQPPATLNPPPAPPPCAMTKSAKETPADHPPGHRTMQTRAGKFMFVRRAATSAFNKMTGRQAS